MSTACKTILAIALERLSDNFEFRLCRGFAAHFGFTKSIVIYNLMIVLATCS